MCGKMSLKLWQPHKSHLKKANIEIIEKSIIFHFQMEIALQMQSAYKNLLCFLAFFTLHLFTHLLDFRLVFAVGNMGIFK